MDAGRDPGRRDRADGARQGGEVQGGECAGSGEEVRLVNHPPLLSVSFFFTPWGEGELTLQIHRKNIDINTAIPARGTKFLQQLYRENLDPIFASWGSYGPDFEWVERAVLYGLFLSDHEILSAVETELVSLPAIMCQGWPAPTLWHLRGFRRLGVSEGDVELVQRGIEAVATWAGRSVEGWPRVKDVKDVD